MVFSPRAFAAYVLADESSHIIIGAYYVPTQSWMEYVEADPLGGHAFFDYSAVGTHVPMRDPNPCPRVLPTTPILKVPGTAIDIKYLTYVLLSFLF